MSVRKEFIMSEAYQQMLVHAEVLEQSGDFTEAIAYYQKALALEPTSAVAHWQIGNLFQQINQPGEAWHHKQQALALQPDLVPAAIHYQLGLNLAGQGQITEAIAWWQRAIAVQPDYAEAHYNLGVAWAELENFDAAIAGFQRATEFRPDYLDAWLNLGALLVRQNKNRPAIAVYQNAVNIAPNCLDAYLSLGYLYTKINELDLAIATFQQAIALDPNSSKAYGGCGAAYEKQNNLDLAVHYLQQSFVLSPDDAETMVLLGSVLMQQIRIVEGIAFLERAYARDPNQLTAFAQGALALPKLYTDAVEIIRWRDRFTQGLHNYHQKILELDFNLPKQRRAALESINSSTNFLLGYQAQNDLPLQVQYGEIVHRIMSAQYPQWAVPLSPPALAPGEKIRIGYISAQLRAHSGTRWLIGWLKYRDRSQFEVYSYLTDFPSDRTTESFARESDYFYHIPDDLDAACAQIRKDNLHVLVYPDIGMHPFNTLMAALRLAPVQCVGWGHPITTGLPTIDYFLSSVAMEPDKAATHYCEQLVLLPKIGVSYPFPTFTPLSEADKVAAKQKFGFRLDAFIFLSCQFLYKYLPQYDFVFPAIAQRLPNCQFAFLSHPSSKDVNALFWRRLGAAFAAYNLDRDAYCVLLPRGNQVDYLIADIALDTIGWSGGNTSLEVIACDLPLVTMPGEFMRGRHAYAMLQVLEVTETVAANTNEYIEIAVRLAVDKPWRNAITAKMRENRALLFDDRHCVRALEDFYRSVSLFGI